MMTAILTPAPSAAPATQLDSINYSLDSVISSIHQNLEALITIRRRALGVEPPTGKPTAELKSVPQDGLLNELKSKVSELERLNSIIGDTISQLSEAI